MKSKQPDVIPVLITKKDLKNGVYGHNHGYPLYKAITRLGIPVTYTGGTFVLTADEEYDIFEELFEGSVIQDAIRDQEPVLVHLLKI